MSDYEPTISDCVEGTRVCPDDSCGAYNSWLEGDRPPDICRKCDAHLCCSWCGDIAELDGNGRCSTCRVPKVRRLVAEMGEFGLRLVSKEASNG